jgi:hypothetical protein
MPLGAKTSTCREDLSWRPQCLSSLNTEATEDLSDLSVEFLLDAEDTEGSVKEENK